MNKSKVYVIDGMQIEIKLKWDAMSNKYLEIYDDIIDNPRLTPLGFPIVTTGQEACGYASDDAYGCSDCVFYLPADKHTWFGSCRNEQNRKIY